MKRKFLIIVTIVGSLLTSLGSCDQKNQKEDGVYYTCPMHPDVKKDEPGQCPICGMDLVKKEDPDNHSDTASKH